MGAIARVPQQARRAAPGAAAPRASDRRNVRLLLSLAWLLVVVAAAGAHHPAAALGRIEPAAMVTASDPVVNYTDDSLAMPHDPMAAHSWPGSLTTTAQMQPIPAFVGFDDPPVLGPAPTVDPAVARLLAQLRDEAKAPSADPRPGPQALIALDFALAQVGRPYVWGATGPDSYDCSGLTWRSYAQAGIALPRVSADQHALGGTPVAIADLLPGDLVFFATAAWDPGTVHHVGMYVGSGLMVDAPHPGAFVNVEPVTAAGYVGAVRVVPALPGASTPTGRPSPAVHTRPGEPSVPPSDAPTRSTTPTGTPADSATPTPSAGDPTASPTDSPTNSPTASPTDSPTASPTASPTDSPTASPTASPSDSPTDSPTDPAADSPTEPAPDLSTDPPSPDNAPPGG